MIAKLSEPLQTNIDLQIPMNTDISLLCINHRFFLDKLACLEDFLMALTQSNIVPLKNVSNTANNCVKIWRLFIHTSPILSGSYFGGSESLVHDGRTPIHSLKLNPMNT
jgi:hypothetical protein